MTTRIVGFDPVTIPKVAPIFGLRRLTEREMEPFIAVRVR
jgi:hypothetical protein